MPSPPKDFEALFDARRDKLRHGEPEKGDKGERPSWRDLDRKRDRSAHSAQGADPRDAPPPADRHQAASAQKALKKDLQDLFRDHGADTLRQQLRATPDRAAAQNLLEQCIEERGKLPADADVLERALDARKDSVALAAVQALASALPSFPEATRKVLVLKLQARARTSFDRRLSDEIRAVLAAQA